MFCTTSCKLAVEAASEKQLNKEMMNRIEEVDKMKPEEKSMIYTFLDAFITKTELQTLL